jgi:flagellar L-ring protein precursor FlgH
MIKSARGNDRDGGLVRFASRWFGRGAVLGLLALSGCAMTPSSIVEHPTTAMPAPLPPAAANGAIYQVGSARPLFEDRRARFVGDTLTIVLNEKNSASLASNKKESHTGSNDASINPNIYKYPTALLSGTTGAATTLLQSSTDSNYENKDQNSNDGALTGTITATVIEVLPNGNLRVSGEKQVAVKNGTDFIRLSGVVNPAFISGNNTVNSTQVADARLEYKSNESIDVALMTSILARFFLSVLPF